MSLIVSAIEALVVKADGTVVSLARGAEVPSDAKNLDALRSGGAIEGESGTATVTPDPRPLPDAALEAPLSGPDGSAGSEAPRAAKSSKSSAK